MKGSAEMKCLAVIATFCICLILAPLAIAQQYAYKPPLGDIMGKVQLRQHRRPLSATSGLSDR